MIEQQRETAVRICGRLSDERPSREGPSEPKGQGRLSPTELAYLAQSLRLDVLEMLHDRQSGHIGGAFSAAEILTVLYFQELRVRPREPVWPGRDRFILSKGHASALLYAVLAARGFLPREELATFRALNSRLQGHPSMHSLPGVDLSTGALGHGIPVGLGMAMASVQAGCPGGGFRVYVLTGDGCLQEGQSWEAAMAAAKFRPPGFTVLVDRNHVQLDGTTAEIMPMGSVTEKFAVFGWDVYAGTPDGHDPAAISEALAWARSTESDAPKVIVFDTVKGKGVSFMEGEHGWHGAPVDDESYAEAKNQLERRLSELEERL
jgi:transketolase